MSEIDTSSHLYLLPLSSFEDTVEDLRNSFLEERSKVVPCEQQCKQSFESFAEARVHMLSDCVVEIQKAHPVPSLIFGLHVRRYHGMSWL